MYKNIDNDVKIEVDIVFDGKTKPAWRLPVLLTVLAIFGKVFKSMELDIMA